MKKSVIAIGLSSLLTELVGAAWLTATNDKDAVILMALGALGAATSVIINDKK